MLYNTVQGENIKIDVVKIQQQQNGSDCGIYVIACMVFLVNKKDPLFYRHLLIKKCCEIIYMIVTKREGLCHFQVQMKI